MTDIRHINETEADLRAQVRSLENECRALKETLRDRFAMAALTGICAHPTGPAVKADEDGPQAVARLAFRVAMWAMAERNAKVSGGGLPPSA